MRSASLRRSCGSPGVPDAMADTWEQVFLTAREEDYMALMEATSALQKS